MPGTAICSARHDASHPPAVYCLHHLRAYAAWEWLVQIQTPEANIRADLLLIWLVLAVVSGWALFRVFRSAWSSSAFFQRQPPNGAVDQPDFTRLKLHFVRVRWLSTTPLGAKNHAPLVVTS